MVARSREVEDLYLQVADLQGDNAQLKKTLSLKQEVHRETLSLMEQSYQAKRQEQQAQLQIKQFELSAVQQELASTLVAVSRKQELIHYLREQLSRSKTSLASNQQVGSS